MTEIETKSIRTPGLRTDPKEGLNPKDLVGATKIDLTLIPQTAIAHMAFAMMEGGRRYGEYNWRVKPIQARTYIAAAGRHLAAWLDGEEEASDSKAHHLAHAMATIAIVLDAQIHGTLVDDRPLRGRASEVLEELAEKLKQQLKEVEDEIRNT